MELLGMHFPDDSLVALVGPSGSGKSTLGEELAKAGLPDAVVSLDTLRGVVSGDCGNQAATPEAVALQNRIVERRLAAGQLVLLDSTNVQPEVRAGLIEQARRHRRPAVAIVLLTPLDVCQERNAARQPNRRVPDDVLRWQHQLAAEAAPGLEGEGFDLVHLHSAPHTP